MYDKIIVVGGQVQLRGRFKSVVLRPCVTHARSPPPRIIIPEFAAQPIAYSVATPPPPPAGLLLLLTNSPPAAAAAAAGPVSHYPLEEKELIDYSVKEEEEGGHAGIFDCLIRQLLDGMDAGRIKGDKNEILLIERRKGPFDPQFHCQKINGTTKKCILHASWPVH